MMTKPQMHRIRCRFDNGAIFIVSNASGQYHPITATTAMKPLTMNIGRPKIRGSDAATYEAETGAKRNQVSLVDSHFDASQ